MNWRSLVATHLSLMSERKRDVVMMRCEMRDRFLASPCVKRGIRGRETGGWSGGEDEQEEEE